MVNKSTSISHRSRQRRQVRMLARILLIIERKVGRFNIETRTKLMLCRLSKHTISLTRQQLRTLRARSRVTLLPTSHLIKMWTWLASVESHSAKSKKQWTSWRRPSSIQNPAKATHVRRKLRLHRSAAKHPLKSSITFPHTHPRCNQAQNSHPSNRTCKFLRRQSSSSV